jgi:phage terminase Nu1 subunit (DNA packaging protein)
MQTFSLDQVVTDQQFADLVGSHRVSVTEWRSKKRLPTPLQVGPALRAYCGRLREQAALRLGHTDGGLDLVQERAALARAQREGVELRNVVLRGAHAEVALLERVLAAAAGAVCERFDHLPARLRTACPDLPQAAIDQVVATIVEARNEWAMGTAALVLKEVLDDDEPELELPLDEEEVDDAAP